MASGSMIQSDYIPKPGKHSQLVATDSYELLTSSAKLDKEIIYRLCSNNKDLVTWLCKKQVGIQIVAFQGSVIHTNVLLIADFDTKSDHMECMMKFTLPETPTRGI